MKQALLSLILFLFASVAHAGLDITAYSGLKIVESPVLSSDGMPQRENQVILESGDFPERFRGLESGKVYQFESSFDFRAGSYSGYNAWRNKLAKLAGYQPSTSVRNDVVELRYDETAWKLDHGPFWELIDFSDAEGTIGPDVCRKVYQDFVQYRDQAAQVADAYFYESYGDWMKAFEMCANHGAIVFH
ncbi:hypothetical protein [Burkholderia ubonensis]|uniref:hypothetical protein n=1 Tax=Burkholderia ubonensis TaxID=101571 RepID=UPI00075DD4A0|nr:hypothetical protein [Burkholderia ubonensis]KVN82401.1 hypothetical protein WJ67_00095 [Burkholderia ubonensis]KVU50833.1 hypothetical protein WK68_29575 [Burkholderia ubonensis]KVZ77042.1 hypothetical protein WL22_06495 [Burkholderia ubonensis]KWD51652.1 hypothetical protein WL67_01260 [Burkholderia ubonensis]KWD56118.1 hypothetical protein WL66_10690 [Burkholderia ubonensis]